jgi:hypothetical protein
MICVVIGVVVSAALAWGAPASNIVEKKLAFPSPIQWKSGDVEISLIGVVWGPADSPEMISKGRAKTQVEKPEFYSDRTFALALGFRAKLPNVVSTEMFTSSGLGRIKNVDEDIEAPVEITPLGFVPYSGSPGIYDIHFNRSSATDYWDLFPVAPDQKEFLFEVLSASDLMPGKGTPKLSFRIVRERGTLSLSTPRPAQKHALALERTLRVPLEADRALSCS